MARRTLRCVILGHKWMYQRASSKSVRRTCQRCREFDIVEQEIGRDPADDRWKQVGGGTSMGGFGM
jgi:hypothetical protein